MEVLRHGKKFRIATCPKCDCEFQFAVTEIKTEHIQTYDYGYYESYDYIECPECAHRLIIDTRAIEV